MPMLFVSFLFQEVLSVSGGDQKCTSWNKNEKLKIIKCVNEFLFYFLTLRTSEIHLFYNLQLFYWHFLEILWLFIFLVFYNY